MSVELGTEPTTQTNVGAACGTHCRDAASPSWKTRQMGKLAQIWNVGAYDIDKSFGEPIVHKTFLKRLVTSARYYPKNVLVPLIREAREERHLKMQADRSITRPSYCHESFLPCDITSALERARDALRSSQVAWRPQDPQLRWPTPRSFPYEQNAQPKAEPTGTPARVVSDLPQALDQGATSESEPGEGQTRISRVQQDNIDGKNQQNLRNNSHWAHGLCQSRDSESTEYHSISSSDSRAGENITSDEHTSAATSTRAPSQHKNQGHADESDDSEVIVRRPLRKRRHLSGGRVAAGVTSQICSAEARDQQDVALPAEEKLAKASDDPRLRRIISRIEMDRTMCFKMRWYVVDHLRRAYRKKLQPSRQIYRRRVAEFHKLQKTPGGEDKLVALRSKPMNRLDFEAARAHEGFRKDQAGWESHPITQILQSAYIQYDWSESITDENVDQILFEAGADLALFDDARRSAGSRRVTPPLTPEQGPLEIIEIESSPERPSYQYTNAAFDRGYFSASFPTSSGTSPRIAQGSNADSASYRPRQVHAEGGGIPEGTDQLRNDSYGGDRELMMLREEVRELKEQAAKDRLFKEAFIQEQKASQKALLAEIRTMRVQAGGNKKRSKRRRNSKKIRRYLRKLKELEAEKSSSSSFSSSEDETSSSSG